MLVTIDVENVIDLAPLFNKPVYNVIIPFCTHYHWSGGLQVYLFAMQLIMIFAVWLNTLYFRQSDHLPSGLDQNCILGTCSISMIKKTNNIFIALRVVIISPIVFCLNQMSDIRPNVITVFF